MRYFQPASAFFAATAVASLTLSTGCVHYGRSSMTRCWADWNTMAAPAAYVETVSHRPYKPYRIDHLHWKYGYPLGDGPIVDGAGECPPGTTMTDAPPCSPGEGPSGGGYPTLAPVRSPRFNTAPERSPRFNTAPVLPPEAYPPTVPVPAPTEPGDESAAAPPHLRLTHKQRSPLAFDSQNNLQRSASNGFTFPRTF